MMHMMDEQFGSQEEEGHDNATLTASGSTSDHVLSTIAHVALGMAIFGLFSNIVLIMCSRKLPRSRLRKPLSDNEYVILNLSFSLLSAHICYLGGVEQITHEAGCIIAGVSIHFFFLACFAWEAIVGFMLCNTFVKTLVDPLGRYFRVKLAVFGWGVPVVIISVVLATNHRVYIGETECFIGGNVGVFYGTFVTPVCVVLLINIVAFVFVIRELSCVRKTSVRSTQNMRTLKTELRRCVILFFLLGLPWLMICLYVKYNIHIIFCGTQAISIFGIQLFGMRGEFSEIYTMWRHSARKGSTQSTISMMSSSLTEVVSCSAA